MQELQELLEIDVCPECEQSEYLQWNCSTRTTGGVPQGRLNSNEVIPIFYLGCEYCSETLGVVDGDDVAELLTEQQSENL